MKKPGLQVTSFWRRQNFFKKKLSFIHLEVEGANWHCFWGLSWTGTPTFSQAGSGMLQTILETHKIHGALGEGHLWTRILFLQTNQTEKRAPRCCKKPCRRTLTPVIGAMLVEGAHFLRWQIKLAANVITNHSMMKQTGTRVSVRLWLICPGIQC